MAHREFTDEQGRAWQVWQVTPGVDVAEHLRGGWLVFETAGERRRFAPPPQGWEDFSDAELRELLREAQPAQRPRRLIE